MDMIRLLAEVDMNSVLNNGMSLGEKLAYFAKILGIGMGCVFGVIFFIWLMLTVFRFFVYEIPNMKKKKAKSACKKDAEAVEALASTATLPNTPPASVQEDNVTVAVNTAALSAYLESSSEDGSTLPFKVVSFKRKRSGTPWNS